MTTVQRLRELLKAYASSEAPRERIALLRYALETAESLDVDKNDIEVLKARLRVISSTVNWEAFRSYALGKWEALKDAEYFKYAELLTELDDIAAALWHVAEAFERREVSL